MKILQIAIRDKNFVIRKYKETTKNGLLLYKATFNEQGSILTSKDIEGNTSTHCYKEDGLTLDSSIYRNARGEITHGTLTSGCGINNVEGRLYNSSGVYEYGIDR